METTIPHMTQAILDSYGWSEAELARAVGVSQAHVNRLKRGLVPNPSFTVGSAIVTLYRDRPAEQPGTDAVA